MSRDEQKLVQITGKQEKTSRNNQKMSRNKKKQLANKQKKSKQDVVGNEQMYVRK